jgi:hypothetical protein
MIVSAPAPTSPKVPTPPSWLPTPDHTPAYLHTSAQMLDSMRALQDRFPDLVQLVDIGDSALKAAGQGANDLWLLRLTNQHANVGKKPTSMQIAGMHAREIANPELLLQWGTKLLEGYGKDAEATALLDTRVIDLVPLVNPDGHDFVTDGFANPAGIDGKIWQRKNMSPAGEVDLNRNYRWHWNGFGTSRDPENDTYRGPSPASEPETVAIQDQLEKVHPGIFVDWHSFSGLNLYPWGDDFGRAPDDAKLKAVAEKFSTFNGYVAQKSIDLYPTSGTSIDHAYGVHRIPSFGIETGDYFHPLEPEFADIQKKNEPVLDYATRIADDPYERAQGPDVAQVALDAGTKVTARVSDAADGGQLIRAAEWTTNPLTAPGTGTPLAAVDGAFDGVDELVTGTFEMPKKDPYKPTPKLVFVRAEDADGHWGPAAPQWITPPAATAARASRPT